MTSPSPTDSAWLEIGKITKPHGLRGFVRVYLFAADSQALVPSVPLRLRLASGETRATTVAEVRPAPGGGIQLRVADCADRNGAEALRGAVLEMSREDLPRLPDDEFYLADAIGCRVVDRTHGYLGDVIRIDDYGAHPLLFVELDGRQINVPAVPEIVLEFDGETVDVDLPEGLIDAVATTPK